MERKLQDNNKGFSLLELLVCLAISGFIILAAFSFVMVGVKSYDNTNKTTSVQQEISFTNNLVGQAIRAGQKITTSIKKESNGNLEMHTGTKVLYYDKVHTSLYIYDETPGADYTVNSADNLVSKYITEFDASYRETDVSGGGVLDYSSAVVGYSNSIKISFSVKVKDKTDKSEVIYEVRN